VPDLIARGIYLEKKHVPESLSPGTGPACQGVVPVPEGNQGIAVFQENIAVSSGPDFVTFTVSFYQINIPGACSYGLCETGDKVAAVGRLDNRKPILME